MESTQISLIEVSIPNDWLSHIFSFVDAEFDCILVFVNKRWNFVVHNYNVRKPVRNVHSSHNGICEYLLKRGCVDAMKFAAENGAKTSVFTTAAASEGGHFHALVWLHQRGVPMDEMTCISAANRGGLATLKYAKENGCKWDSYVPYFAAAGGHLDVLQYALDQGCEFNVEMCANAAQNGRLEVLKWAKERNLPWDSQTCTRAAKHNQLECLIYAKQQGCPCDDEWTTLAAAESGSLDCLKWIMEKGKGRMSPFAQKAAERRKMYHIIEWA